MPIVKVYDQNISFPDDLSPDELQEAVASSAQQLESSNVQKPGLMRRAAEAVIDSPILPTAGAIVGGIAGIPAAPVTFGASNIAGAGLGGAAGESFRQLGARALGMDAPRTPLEAAGKIGVEGALSAAGEGAGRAAVAAAKPLVVPAARRALGFAKPFLKTNFARAEATRAATVALENDIIPVLGSPEVAFQRASDLAKSAGNKIGEVLKKIDFEKIAPNAEYEMELLRKKLTKGTDRGLLAGANKIIDTVKETILELYGRGATAADYSVAKNNLAGLVNFATEQTTQKTNKTVVKNMADSLRQTVSKLLPESYDDFIKNQRLFHGAELMKKALNDEIAKQMGNNVLSLPALLAGTVGVAQGNVAGAAGAVGLTELLKRRGYGMTARGLQGLVRKPYIATVPAQIGGQMLGMGLGFGQRRRSQ